MAKAFRRSRRESTRESGSGQKELVDRNEMRKEEKNLRCAMLNGSAWSTERKYMRRYRGTFDVFFGIKHRLRKELQQRGQGRMEVCSERSKNH